MARSERGVGMKQRIKQFLLTVALCLTLAVLIPFSAFAKIDQKVLDSAEQGAKKNISTIMSFDEAMLQNYIDQFEANGETKMADGLKSWQTIREDVGDVTAVDDAVAKEVDDDNILVTVKAHCGDREVVAHLGYQVSSGDITELNFSKVETLGEKFESAGLNLIIGMGTVFAVLIFIAFLISRFKYIHDWVSRKEAIEKEEREYKEKVAAIQRMPKSAKNVSKRISAEQVKAAQVPEGTKVQCISAPEETAVESESVPAETVAVLAAAVAANEEPQLDSQMLAVLTAAALAAEGEDPGPDGLVVKSLRRRGNSKRRRH